jgi:hypothetical protein
MAAKSDSPLGKNVLDFAKAVDKESEEATGSARAAK